MDLKDVLKACLFGSISIIAFILITLFSSWIGIEKEFFITICILATLGVIFGIIKFTWGIARRRGIEYFWYLIFSIVLYYGLFINIFQIFEIIYLNLPWYISFAIAISPILFMSIAYIIYKITADDEVKAGILTFLISLLFGQTIATQIDKPIAKEIANNSPKIVSIMDEVAENTPILSNGIKYLKEEFPIIARTTTQVGKLGEHITNRLLTSQGYKKISSKIFGNQGIDHIFVKYNKKGEISKVQIVETKVNTSQLRPDQMTDIGILNRIEKLLSKPEISNEEKQVYEFIKNNIETNKVVKQLFNHNTSTNITTISKLGKNQDIIQTSSFNNNIIQKVFE